MKFGFTTSLDSLDNIAIARDLGYDYVELNFGQLAGMSEEDFAKKSAAFLELGFPALCCNCFLGGDVNIYSDTPGQREYNEAFIDSGARKAKLLGVKKVVFGSGWAKSYPDGADRDECYKKLCAFTARAAGILAGYDIGLVIEPLRSKESNVINTVADGVKLARDCGDPTVRGLGDVFHMVEMGEPIGPNPEFRGMLSHCHISRPMSDGRVYMSDPGEFDYQSFIDEMIDGGCDTCSIEAGVRDFPTDAAAAIKVLRSLKV